MNWDLQEAIAYYRSQGAPSDQHTLIALLKEVNQQNGGVSPEILKTIASAYEIRVSLLHALIHRIPGLRLMDTHCLELCAGGNCGRHRALAALAEELAASRLITVKYVPCMRMCGKGPNIRWDGTVYHHADEALLKRLLG